MGFGPDHLAPQQTRNRFSLCSLPNGTTIRLWGNLGNQQSWLIPNSLHPRRPSSPSAKLFLHRAMRGSPWSCVWGGEQGGEIERFKLNAVLRCDACVVNTCVADLHHCHQNCMEILWALGKTPFSKSGKMIIMISGRCEMESSFAQNDSTPLRVESFVAKNDSIQYGIIVCEK